MKKLGIFACIFLVSLLNIVSSAAIIRTSHNSDLKEASAGIVMFLLYAIPIAIVIMVVFAYIRCWLRRTIGLLSIDCGDHSIEDIVLGKGVHRGMKINEVKKLYGLHKKSIKEQRIKNRFYYIEYSQNKKKHFLYFHKYNNVFRLYEVRIEYDEYEYKKHDFEMTQSFLNRIFGDPENKISDHYLMYNRLNTSACLYADNYNIRVIYRSNKISHLFPRQLY